MKKRGLGRGRWNAPGGKRHTGESIEACACRELEEETGCKAEESNLAPRGVIEFVFEASPFSNRCFLFEATSYDATQVRETDEMAPQWFTLDTVPYDEMWEDDEIWLPKVLDGETVNLRFFFGENDKIDLSKTETLDVVPVPAVNYVEK